MPRDFCFHLGFTSMAPAWWFCPTFEDNDKSGSFFPPWIWISLESRQSFKIPFLTGPGIFLASLTVFSLPVAVPDSTQLFLSFYDFPSHVCSLLVSFWVGVTSSRKPWNPSGTRDIGKCPPASLLPCQGLDKRGHLHSTPVCPSKPFLKKFSPGLVSCDFSSWMNSEVIKITLAFSLHTWIWYFRVISRWLLYIEDEDLTFIFRNVCNTVSLIDSVVTL